MTTSYNNGHLGGAKKQQRAQAVGMGATNILFISLYFHTPCYYSARLLDCDGFLTLYEVKP